MKNVHQFFIFLAGMFLKVVNFVIWPSHFKNVCFLCLRIWNRLIKLNMCRFLCSIQTRPKRESCILYSHIVYLNSLNVTVCWNLHDLALEPFFLRNPHGHHSGKCLVSTECWHVMIDKSCTPEPQQPQKTTKVIASSLGQLYNWAWGHLEDMERDNEAIELQFVAGRRGPPVGHYCEARRPFQEFKVHLLV